MSGPELVQQEPRIGGAEYYSRLKVENEFRNQGQKRVFAKEVQRRFNRHRSEQEKKLDERRRRLLTVLQCEGYMYEELCREHLCHEQKKIKANLFTEAERLKGELLEKKRQIAEEKNACRNESSDLQALHKAHLREIMRDRETIAKMVERDKMEQEKLDQLVGIGPTLLEEQLEREKQAEHERQYKLRELAEGYLREAEVRKRGILQEKQAEREEGLRFLEKLKREDEQEHGAYDDKVRKQAEMLHLARSDLVESRKYRERERYLGELVDAYCNPFLEMAGSRDVLKEQERLRKEQLQFMEYQKQVAKDEECFDKHTDRLYAEIARGKEAKERERMRKARERAAEEAKQTVEHHHRVFAEKVAAQKAATHEQKEIAEMIKRDHEQYVEQVRREKQERLDRNRKFLEASKVHAEQTNQLRRKLTREEVEREREVMFRTECEYRQRLTLLAAENPALRHLHPWRKHAMANNH
ncbi:hypothetical protein CRM22_005657 [Opisthorchis felineus]|uniref:Trichohyalin-plectin-homology domain-containing protein n=1 Tax=Opisthorchis felineus TaxID=147828 RepID=A0A4S2LQ75_OPIFE|nr:hypothetical protein CRM22_005657 [Opisthorchis felineus]